MITMHNISLLLICLLGQAASGYFQRNSSPREWDATDKSAAVKALASVFLASDPAAGFSLSSVKANAPRQHDSRAHDASMQTPKPVFTPPPWAPGLTKKEFELIPEPSPRPWIPSWLEEEEKAERRLDEAQKWKPTYIPEPWIGPLADDNMREKIWDDHDRVLGAQSAAPPPAWVGDWLQEAGEPFPTCVGEIQGYGMVRPGERIVFVPPPWAEGLEKKEFERIPEPSREPWIPSWLDEEEQEEKRLDAALKWRPDYIPEPWIGPMADDEAREKIMDRHWLICRAQRAAPCPKWVMKWMAEGGKPVPLTAGEMLDMELPSPEPWKPSWVEEDDEEAAPSPAGAEPAPAPYTPPWASEATPAAGSTVTNVAATFTEGDEVEFKVKEIIKTGNKLAITLEGPFTFTTEAEIAA